MEKKYQLPKEFAERWVKALRSGKYEQTTDCQLKLGDCYCVLGVAGIVAELKISIKGDEFLTPITEEPNSYDPLYNVFGMDYNVGYRFAQELYRLNDTQHLTFPEIADWIESNVEFV